MKSSQLLTAFLLSATVASAILPPASFAKEETREATRGANRLEEREGRVERIEERVHAVEERLEEKTEKVREGAQTKITQLREKRAEIIKLHSGRLRQRFIEIYYTKLANFAARIQKRLDVMKSNGTDISDAQAKLNQAKTDLELAKTKALDAIAAFEAINPEDFESKRDTVLAARDKANVAREAFVAVWKQLIESVKSAKASSEDSAV